MTWKQGILVPIACTGTSRCQQVPAPATRNWRFPHLRIMALFGENKCRLLPCRCQIHIGHVAQLAYYLVFSLVCSLLCGLLGRNGEVGHHGNLQSCSGKKDQYSYLLCKHCWCKQCWPTLFTTTVFVIKLINFSYLQSNRIVYISSRILRVIFHHHLISSPPVILIKCSPVIYLVFRCEARGYSRSRLCCEQQSLPLSVETSRKVFTSRNESCSNAQSTWSGHFLPLDTLLRRARRTCGTTVFFCPGAAYLSEGVIDKYCWALSYCWLRGLKPHELINPRHWINLLLTLTPAKAIDG